MKSIFKNGVKIIAAIVLLLALIPSGFVGASSPYDSTVVPAASWDVTSETGNDYQANISEAINNITDLQQKQTCEAVYKKFMQMDYRGYYIYQPSRYSPVSYAHAIASDELPQSTQWDISGDTTSAHALWHHDTFFQLEYANGQIVPSSCVDNTAATGDIYVTYAMAWNDGFVSIMPYLLQGFEADYPYGYAGDSIASDAIGGLIAGNVQCANTSNIISAVHINPQQGLDGNAKITDDGMGGVNYRYYLSQESPYYLTVLCDGDIFTGPTVNSNFYYNYNWVCTNTVPGQGGNLHVCAAS